MTKYRYEVVVTGYFDVDVVADSEDEAEEKVLEFYEKYHATTLRHKLDSISLDLNLRD